MSQFVEGLVIALAVSWPLQWMFPTRYANGKIFSRWLRRKLKWQRANIRMSQIVAVSAIELGAQEAFGIRDHIQFGIFWSVYILLFVDDYLTGDDDQTKRFLNWVKNKIRWKMYLPQTASESS